MIKRDFIHIVLVLFSFAALPSLAQDSLSVTDTAEVVEDLVLPRGSYLYSSTMSFTVPNPIGSTIFKNNFLGIYQITGALKLSLFKGFRIGVDFSNAQFKIDKNIIRDYNINVSKSYNPRIIMFTAAVSLGNQIYLGENNRLILAADVSVGQTYAKFSSFSCKDSLSAITLTDFKSWYGKTSLSLYFLMEKNWGLGPTISYTIINRSLMADEICLDDWTKTDPSANQNNLQHINFGFVVYYSFSQK